MSHLLQLILGTPYTRNKNNRDPIVLTMIDHGFSFPKIMVNLIATKHRIDH